jgi:hypothetical protein
MTNAVPLRDLSRYKVADGNADVRGWDVFDRDGTRVGTVDDLLVDPAAEQVRYLAVRLSPELAGGGVPPSDPEALDNVSPVGPLTGMAALGTMAGQGITGNPMAAGLPGMLPGLGTVPMSQAAPVVPAESESRRILIPISKARLERGDHRVTVDGRAAEIAALPGYAE